MKRRLNLEHFALYGLKTQSCTNEDGVVTARTAIDRYSIWINTADLRVLETHLHVHDSWSFTKLQRQTTEQFFKDV